MATIRYLMKCGHVANAACNGKPCCVICAPDTKAHEIDKECTGSDGLDGRMAKCSYCDTSIPSKWALPFFEYRPTMDTDKFYCGCFGWD